MDCKYRIEQVREPNAMGLSNEPVERSVAVETPRAPGLDHLKTGLVVAIEDLVRDAAVCGAVDQRQRL